MLKEEGYDFKTHKEYPPGTKPIKHPTQVLAFNRVRIHILQPQQSHA